MFFRLFINPAMLLGVFLLEIWYGVLMVGHPDSAGSFGHWLLFISPLALLIGIGTCATLGSRHYWRALGYILLAAPVGIFLLISIALNGLLTSGFAGI